MTERPPVTAVRDHIASFSRELHQLWSHIHSTHVQNGAIDLSSVEKLMQKPHMEHIVLNSVPPVVFVPWWGKLWKRTFQSAVAVDLEELLSHETLKRFVEHDKGSNSLQEPVVPDQVAQVDTWTKSLQIAVYYLSQCTRAYWLLAARYFEVDPAGREFKHRKISPSFDIDIDKVHDLEYQVMTEDQYKQQLKTSVHHQLLPVNFEDILRAIYRKSLLTWVHMLHKYFTQLETVNAKSFQDYIEFSRSTTEKYLKRPDSSDCDPKSTMSLYFGAAMADQLLRRKSSAADIISALYSSEDDDDNDDQDLDGNESSDNGDDFARIQFLVSALKFQQALCGIDGHNLRSSIIFEILQEHIENVVGPMCHEDNTCEDTNLVQTLLEYLRIFVLNWFHAFSSGVETSYDLLYREMNNRSNHSGYWCGIVESTSIHEDENSKNCFYNIGFSWEPPKCGTSTPLSSDNSKFWSLNRLLLCSDNSSEIWSYMSKLSQVEKQEHGISESNTEGENTTISQQADKSVMLLLTSFVERRSSQVFELIKGYPSSTSQLVELHWAIRFTGMYERIITAIKAALEDRLLHAGAATSQVLTALLLMVKALRVLDPSGVVLQRTFGPVKDFMCQRKDAAACVINALTDADGEHELYQALVSRQQTGVWQPSEEGEDEWIAAGSQNIFWTPEPVEADPNLPTNFRFQDTLSLVLNMFDSVDVLLKTYRSMLAEQLLSKDNFDVDEELQTLELLKMLFGESKLHNCEVMLKDMADSKRLLQTIKSEHVFEEQKSILPNAKVVSDHYWPSFTQSPDFKVHPALEEQLHLYAVAFSKAKNPRYVKWMKSSGHVNLSIKRGEEETWEPSVSFLQASIMLYFQQQSTWSLEALAENLELSPNDARQGMNFWIRNGIIRRIGTDQNKEEYSSIENPNALTDQSFLDEQEDEYAETGTEADVEQMRMCENFILGMLKTFSTMTLDQIHQKLKLFMAGDSQGYDKTPEELHRFLMRLVKEEKISMDNGTFHPVK